MKSMKYIITEDKDKAIGKDKERWKDKRKKTKDKRQKTRQRKNKAYKRYKKTYKPQLLHPNIKITNWGLRLPSSAMTVGCYAIIT